MSFVWDYLLDAVDPLDLLISFVSESVERVDWNMPPKAIIVHHAKGRVRLRIPQRRYDTNFFEDIAHRLADSSNVTRVDVNPRSASILILYSGDIPTLLQDAYDAGVTDLITIDFPKAPAPITTQLAGRLQRIDNAIVQRTHGGADGSAVIVTLLLAAAGVELARGRVFGAIPMLWYAGQAIGGLIPTAALPFRSSSQAGSGSPAEQRA